MKKEEKQGFTPEQKELIIELIAQAAWFVIEVARLARIDVPENETGKQESERRDDEGCALRDCSENVVTAVEAFKKIM